ncbi:FimV/HubP family polar landmark protein [Dasania marina]|uniref:FimV/HubP family polar landmark protein n=1 Tax=Dasania marina TaxID=471499 RepID=UPI0003801085|nr:FimV/HubP family polar landmark protein [Dasania marina]
MMVRKKLAVVVAALGALQTDVASALGLGELSLSSALNQPLEAEIRLLDTGELDATQVLVKLGAREDFDRAGVSRDFFLSNLKFKVEVNENGHGVIKINTRENVIEPYLDFIIEARWPSGRILREYTVLLDLPTYSAVPAPTVTASAVTSAAKIADSKVMVPAPKRAVPPQPRSTGSSSRESLRQGTLKPGESYRVRRDETLWEIAAKSRPTPNTSVQQSMLGIQRANPEAFINGNINRLKAGYVLRIPTQNQIADISDNLATKEVANQNRAWKTGEQAPSLLTEAPLDASATTAKTDKAAAADARLSIAGSGSSDKAGSDGVGSNANGSAALSEELAVAAEDLEKTKRHNDELAGRLSDMEAKMATLQRLLELKEDQLAALQSSKGQPVTSAEPAKTQAAAVPKAEPSFVDQLLSPLNLGIAGGLIALAAIVALLRRRKQADQEQEMASAFAEPEAEDLDELSLGDEDLGAELDEQLDDSDIDLAEANVGDFAIEEEMEAVVEEPAPVQSETGDAIAEADIYIAYGRFQQAMDLLKTAHSQEPQRSDILVKLLEVCLEARDKPSFQEFYVKLQALGDESAVIQVKEMLSSIDGVADWLDDLPSTALDISDADMDAELIDGDESEESLELESVDLGLDDDDLELDLELDLEGDDLEDLSESRTMQFDTSLLDQQLGADSAEEDGAALELDEGELDLELELDESGLDEALAGLSLEDELEPLDDDSLDLDLADFEAELESDDAPTVDKLELEEEHDLAADLELAVDLESTDSETEQEPELEALNFSADLDDLNADLDSGLDSDLDLESLSLDEDSDSFSAELDGDDFELSEELSALDSELELTEQPATGEKSADEGDLPADPSEELVSLDEDLTEEDLVEQLDEAVSDLGADAQRLDLDLTETNESFDEPVTVDEDDDEFDFLSDTDEVATKLDLARAYIDMGDTDGAKDILDEVVQEGSDEQKQEASALLERV